VNGAGCGSRVGFGSLLALVPATAGFAELWCTCAEPTCFVLCCSDGGSPTMDGVEESVDVLESC